MPIKGILFVLVAVIVVAAVEKDAVYDWLENQFGDKENKEENE